MEIKQKDLCMGERSKKRMYLSYPYIRPPAAFKIRWNNQISSFLLWIISSTSDPMCENTSLTWFNSNETFARVQWRHCVGSKFPGGTRPYRTVSIGAETQILIVVYIPICMYLALFYVIGAVGSVCERKALVTNRCYLKIVKRSAAFSSSYGRSVTTTGIVTELVGRNLH